MRCVVVRLCNLRKKTLISLMSTFYPLRSKNKWKLFRKLFRGTEIRSSQLSRFLSLLGIKSDSKLSSKRSLLLFTRQQETLSASVSLSGLTDVGCCDSHEEMKRPQSSSLNDALDLCSEAPLTHSLACFPLYDTNERKCSEYQTQLTD